MPLTRDQLNQIIEILVPHVNVSDDDRRALIQRAFFGEPVVDQLTYSGQAVTFAMNCVLNLKKYNTETAVVQLLETLRDYYVGGDVQAQINALLASMDGKPNPSTGTAIETPQAVEKLVLDAPLFVSYSRKDITFVNKLRGDLNTHGVPYWIDQEGLSPGTPNWERALKEAIHKCSAVLWIVSPASNASEYVYSELAIAEMYKRRIYPVWADGENWVDCVPMGKHRIQFVNMRGSSYATGLEQLLAALGKTDSEYIVPPEETPELPPDAAPRNPYKGLEAFHEDDVDDFFGREALVSSLADRLGTQLAEDKARFLAVLGPSGAGKSSVVMAGLLPALKNKDAIPGSKGWYYLPMITPGAHPMESLAGAFATLTSSADPTTVLTKLYALGIEYLNIVFDMLPVERVVLYIDQFEELFTLAKDDGERQAFISLLSGAATEPNGKLIVLLSMRADFLDYPLNYPQLGTLFDKYTALVQPMSIPELRDAIQKPAQQSGLSFDDGLVADIVFALRGQDKALAGALPLLQFTLERLYEERDGEQLTRDAYERMGGVSGAIGTHSETIYQSLPEAAQDTLGQVFLPLVNIDEETGEPTRRRAPLADVVADPDAKTLVDVFVNNGLLQRGRDGERRYLEVTHEALLRSWDALVMWIKGTQEDLILLRQVRTAAAEWHDKERPVFLLWPQERLVLVYATIERLKPELSEVERDFIEPEQNRLYRELEDIHTTHQRRYDIGERLSRIGETRIGIGLKEGLPDIIWLPVSGSGGPIAFKDEDSKIYGEFTVQSLYIAKYLVTFAQFQAFIDSGEYDNPLWWKDFPRTYQPQAAINTANGNANAPRDTVSWYQSVAFGRWLTNKYQGLELAHPSQNGGPFVIGQNVEIRLPTEWEWQWVAMAGIKDRDYPWGKWDTYPRANTSDAGINDRSTAVGVYPHGAAECGALDMAGNLWEWCLNKTENTETTTIIVDDSGNRRVLRGGSCYHPQNNARCASRYYLYPSGDFNYYGLRLCVGVGSPF